MTGLRTHRYLRLALVGIVVALAASVLIELAQIEKQAENMAIELETTRRRVNALEHKMIPDLKETVKYIKMKLDESERGAIVGTMRVKASIQAQEA